MPKETIDCNIDELYEQFTEKHRNLPVYFNDAAQIIKEIVEKSIDLNNKQQDDILKSINRIVDYVRDIEYRRTRDTRFIISMLPALRLTDKNVLLNTYDLWCKDFDKLNRGDTVK